MAFVEVILREKIENLGAEADIVKVRRGYARNFLLPQAKAYEATKGNKRHLESLQKARAQREADELIEAENVAKKLKKLRLNTTLSIGQGGKAFGSVTSADVADLINSKSKLDIDRHQIQLDKPNKGLGSFEIPIKIHATVPATISLRVLAEGEEEAGESAE
ncbi:MAG: 50S ribosomal protein L9 [Verrucomicrobiota bacterium]